MGGGGGGGWVARVERVDAEGDQADGDDPEQERTVGGIGDLRQRTVETNRLVRVEVDGGFDQEDADQAEHDHPRSAVRMRIR